MEKGRLFPTEAGTPQGGIISPTLANEVLDGLEGHLAQHLRKKGIRYANQAMVHLVRYADDFVITGATEKLLEEEVKPRVEGFLQARGLELSQDKTSIVHIDKGFDFLGWNFRKYGGKLLIKPSRKNVKAVLKTLRNRVKANKATKQEDLIRQPRTFVEA